MERIKQSHKLPQGDELGRAPRIVVDVDEACLPVGANPSMLERSSGTNMTSLLGLQNALDITVAAKGSQDTVMLKQSPF